MYTLMPRKKITFNDPPKQRRTKYETIKFNFAEQKNKKKSRKRFRAVAFFFPNLNGF